MSPLLRRAASRLAVLLAALLLAAHLVESVLDAVDPLPADLLAPRTGSSCYLDREGGLLWIRPEQGMVRITTTPETVPPHLIQALLCAEDRAYFSHGGVDKGAVLRAALQAAVRGRVVSGASTLTMQLARMLEPRPRTLAGKWKEMRRARQLERTYDKDQLLSAYLTHVPLGGQLYGFEAAAWTWCGKPARELSVAEAVMLVAMLPAPSRRAPGKAPELLRYHRNRILSSMFQLGLLEQDRYQMAVAEPLPSVRQRLPAQARLACLQFPATGPVVQTTIDAEIQRTVEDVVARLRSNHADGVAVVVLDRTGQTLALLGAAEESSLPLDLTLTRRSAGSTLKPFLFALALDLGVTTIDGLVADTPKAFPGWRPANFDPGYRGAMRTANALSESRNLPAVRLLHAVGLQRFRSLLEELGIPLPAQPLHLDAALGTLDVSPLVLARAYVRFAAVQRGLSLSARSVHAVLAALEHHGIALKTGTSSGRRDAWAVGVTDRHVLVVWQGNRRGHGDPDLVGRDAAQPMLMALVSALGVR